MPGISDRLRTQRLPELGNYGLIELTVQAHGARADPLPSHPTGDDVIKALQR